MNWADSLKIAILEGDTQKAYELIINVPTTSLNELEDLLIAQELIAQGIEMLEKDQEKVKKQMLQLKLAKKFLE
ncbi:hypothetical protein BKH46_03355 [Helicobacter sp. 12S02634-8]|uniref:hypothetical protein n=1 Tax=Helicobacter sp. 12S02634-8 TaxID=1476199 RepID=UPI000BA6FBDD|nr:hypothetical protein [Helicobacter sp. 12S02634-8]PAF47487.1 hypothetical protein BKH46_03355 [Helicobacter sp. 12S02634-8]